MAFASASLGIENLGNGYIIEYGTYTGVDGAVTTGEVTATASAAGVQGIYTIVAFGASSDSDTAVICATDVAPNVLKLTFQASDLGKWFIIGKAK